MLHRVPIRRNWPKEFRIRARTVACICRKLTECTLSPPCGSKTSGMLNMVYKFMPYLGLLAPFGYMVLGMVGDYFSSGFFTSMFASAIVLRLRFSCVISQGMLAAAVGRDWNNFDWCAEGLRQDAHDSVSQNPTLLSRCDVGIVAGSDTGGGRRCQRVLRGDIIMKDAPMICVYFHWRIRCGLSGCMTCVPS